METKEEIWKDIPNYEGLYQVSNYGKIRSLGQFAKKGIKGRILVPFVGGAGYLYVALSDRQQQIKKYRVHRLVMKTFNGDSELTVNHIDENKRNNKLTNLQYLTQAENCNYGSRNEKISEKMKLIVKERGREKNGTFTKSQKDTMQTV